MPILGLLKILGYLEFEGINGGEFFFRTEKLEKVHLDTLTIKVSVNIKEMKQKEKPV